MLFKIAISLYSAILYLIKPLLHTAAVFNGKIGSRLRSSKRSRNHFASVPAGRRGEARKVWFHVASVGEFLQAKPVISLLSENAPFPIEIALTFSSPSGVDNFSRFISSSEKGMIGFVDYLLLDTPSNMRFCIDRLNPDIIIYVKYDLWPNLILEASGRNIPQILISAGLSGSSGRYKPIARHFYGRLYSLLDLISASTEADASRFRKYAPEADIIAGGDTKYDQVYERIKSSTHSHSFRDKLPAGEYIIAGSTWPRGENIVLNAFSGLRNSYQGLSLIVAPHEPSSERIAHIIESAKKLSMKAVPLTGLDMGTEADVIIADGVGYLAELYMSGTIAYVGGGFGSGVHNVLEPAIFSLPVLFGPGIDNSHEAKDLVMSDAAAVISDSEQFLQECSSMLSNRSLLESRGKRGREYIESNLGASRRYCNLILEYIE